MTSEVAHLHPDVAKAFDSLARQYDELFGDNAIIERLRKKLYSTIDFLVRPPAQILDINCGTGTDGLYLAGKGFTVVGVDLSARMIAEAARKSRSFPNARFVEGSYEDLNHVESNRFDLVLSNFGGLNCTQNLPRVGAQVAAKLKPRKYGDRTIHSGADGDNIQVDIRLQAKEIMAEVMKSIELKSSNG